MFMTTTEHVARHQMPALGGYLEPAHGQRLVLLDPLAVQQNLAEQGLGIENPFAGSDQDRLSSTCRTVIKHGFEVIAVEHFFTA